MTGRQVTPRMEWQRTRGFALHTHVNDCMLEELRGELASVQQVSYQGDPSALLDTSAMTLFITTSSFAEQVKRKKPEFGVETEFYEQYGIPQDELGDADIHAYDSGFADPEFPWHFSAGVANAVVNYLVRQKVVTPDEKASFSLGDWANVIGSGWFSDVMHDLALTSNGTWSNFGMLKGHYSVCSFESKVHTMIGTKKPVGSYEGLEIFEHQVCQDDLEDDVAYDTVVLHKSVVRSLRQRLKVGPAEDKGSVGCPVARTSVRFSDTDMYEGSPVNSLVARNVLQHVPERSAGNYTRLRQENTAIDRTLAFVALQMDTYQHTYGTPYVLANGRVEHRNTPECGVLRHDI